VRRGDGAMPNGPLLRHVDRFPTLARLAPGAVAMHGDDVGLGRGGRAPRFIAAAQAVRLRLCSGNDEQSLVRQRRPLCSGPGPPRASASKPRRRPPSLWRPPAAEATAEHAPVACGKSGAGAPRGDTPPRRPSALVLPVKAAADTTESRRRQIQCRTRRLEWCREGSPR
jgi:hypothetical protein